LLLEWLLGLLRVFGLAHRFLLLAYVTQAPAIRRKLWPFRYLHKVQYVIHYHEQVQACGGARKNPGAGGRVRPHRLHGSGMFIQVLGANVFNNFFVKLAGLFG